MLSKFKKYKELLLKFTSKDVYPPDVIKEFFSWSISGLGSLALLVISFFFDSTLFVLISTWALAISWMHVKRAITSAEKYLEKLKRLAKKTNTKTKRKTPGRKYYG